MAMNHGADYSRQLRVAGWDAAAQERLATARVLLLGAGGLGVVAAPYLIGAGLGQLTLVDDDHIEASNLPRQIAYDQSQIGAAKAEALAEFCRARSRSATVIARPRRLAGAELEEALGQHDLALDCSDSPTLAAALNDAALRRGRPVVFASAAGLSGQLFNLFPGEDAPCWRCLWPEDIQPGGNCDALGVLGPVPGVLGLLQALEAMKILTGFAAPLRGQVLQYDFARLQQHRFTVPRRSNCNHRPPALEPEPDWPDTLAAALAAGFSLVDIRDPEEIAARPLPLPASNVPMAELLVAPPFAPDSKILLVCARGPRAQRTARSLRTRGFGQVWAYPRPW